MVAQMNTCSFSALVLCTEYSYIRGGGTEFIADYSHSRGSGTERPKVTITMACLAVPFDTFPYHTTIPHCSITYFYMT